MTKIFKEQFRFRAPLEKGLFYKHSLLRSLCVTLALTLLLAGSAVAQVGGIAPRFLIDVSSPAAPGQISLNDEGQSKASVGKDGVSVAIAGGPSAYPGIVIKPATGSSWDLTPYGRVDAKLTNTGTEPISMGMRVDNANDGESCNCEVISLKPGETQVLKVFFGYSFGKKAFSLKPGAVTQILVMVNFKSDKPRSFRLEDLQATGSAGEKPPVDPNTLQVVPENGVIFGAGTTLDATKQLAPRGGAKAALANGGIQVDFAGGPKDEAVAIRPAAGSWNLSDYFQVKVKLKNTGTLPVTPKVRLESRGGSSDMITAAAPILPNTEAEITVPFSAVVSPVIPTDPRMEIFGPGTWSEQNWGQKEGTGTKFFSAWGTAVTILSDTTDGAKSLLVTSIVASVPTPVMPEWLGKRPPVDGDWVKTLDENFDGNSLDLNRWNIYTDNYWDRRTHFSKDNAIVKDGKLILHYEKKTGYHNDNPEDVKTVKQTDYACGFADTFGKWRQRYGYFEARVKLPKAPGLWPAFWTMPDRGPEAGPSWARATTANGGMEHDILEYLSGWGPFRYNMAFHWDGYGKEHKSGGGSCNYVLPDKDGYITTGVYWVPGLAVYYAQGKEVMRWASPRVCSVPSYIMFNMVSGGWDNLPLEDAKLPDDFVIDYVRVWQRKDLASPVDGPMPNKGLPSSVSEENIKK